MWVYDMTSKRNIIFWSCRFFIKNFQLSIESGNYKQQTNHNNYILSCWLNIHYWVTIEHKKIWVQKPTFQYFHLNRNNIGRDSNVIHEAKFRCLSNLIKKMLRIVMFQGWPRPNLQLLHPPSPMMPRWLFKTSKPFLNSHFDAEVSV